MFVDRLTFGACRRGIELVTDARRPDADGETGGKIGLRFAIGNRQCNRLVGVVAFRFPKPVQDRFGTLLERIRGIGGCFQVDAEGRKDLVDCLADRGPETGSC